MSTMDIIWVPDPVLKKTAQPVETVDDNLRTQIDNMLETMYGAPGIGLAANQVGLLNRVFVMDTDYREGEVDKNPICMINPEIIWESEEKSVMEEGCLSLPGQFADIERPARVRVKFLNYDGEEEEIEAGGLKSHCIQHELDHLNGVLFTDYLSRLKRSTMIRRVKKLKKQRDVI